MGKESHLFRMLRLEEHKISASLEYIDQAVQLTILFLNI